MIHLKGNHFSCYFLFIVLSLSSYMFHLACIFMPSVFPNSNDATPLIIIIITALLILSLTTLFIRYQFHDQLLRLNHLGKKYQNIEKYFPCFSALILFLFILILVPFTVLQLHNLLIPVRFSGLKMHATIRKESDKVWIIARFVKLSFVNKGIFFPKGQTTKGDDRGKGLLIVQQLISQYPNAVLNNGR